MKISNVFIIAIIAGLISGIFGDFIYQSMFINHKSEIIYDKLVSVPMTEISSYTLLQRMAGNKNDFVIVDVRDKDAYNLGHIKGAISMPLEELGKDYVKLPKDKDIVIYCWSHECGLGPKASASLAILGFTNVKELRIGWCEWSERGYPIEGKRYILSSECLQPQRSIDNESIEVIKNLKQGAS